MRTKLVERDVSVFADAAEEQLDAPAGLHLSFAFAYQIVIVLVEDIHVRGWDVDWTDEPCSGDGAKQAEIADALCEKNSRNIKVWYDFE